VLRGLGARISEINWGGIWEPCDCTASWHIPPFP
jgi:hypothetical protein